AQGLADPLARVEVDAQAAEAPGPELVEEPGLLEQQLDSVASEMAEVDRGLAEARLQPDEVLGRELEGPIVTRGRGHARSADPAEAQPAARAVGRPAPHAAAVTRRTSTGVRSALAAMQWRLASSRICRASSRVSGEACSSTTITIDVNTGPTGVLSRIPFTTLE